MATINLIVACDKEGGIGLNNNLPWPSLKEDMLWFKKHTINNICMMGSNTWLSLPEKFRPLPRRINVVFSSKPNFNYPKADYVLNGGRNMAAVSYLKTQHPTKDIYIIGGKRLFETWLPDADYIHITRINDVFKSDTYIDIKTLLNSCSLKYNRECNSEDVSYAMETYQCKST